MALGDLRVRLICINCTLILSSNARFVVVDGKELIFMVTNDEEVHPTYDIGIWVNTPFFASALEDLFELAWKEMQKPEEVIELK